LTNNVNAFATMVSHGINCYNALKTVNLVDDVNQVYADSKNLIEKYQDGLFNKETKTTDEGRLSADNSDQISNSPFLN
jgi:flagellar basal body rod protein FlgF